MRFVRNIWCGIKEELFSVTTIDNYMKPVFPQNCCGAVLICADLLK